MNNKHPLSSFKYVFTALFLFQGISSHVIADDQTYSCRIFKADRVFDGYNLLPNAAVMVRGDKVVLVEAQDSIPQGCGKTIDLGDATILPGFIESHAHITYQNVSADTVLKHGVTTVRDTGGPLREVTGGKGELRLLSAGPIIQATGGYPSNLFGGGDGGHHGSDIISTTADSPEEARHLVHHLAEAGAVVIKIALEVGGEHGAPWSGGHGHGTAPATPWPIMDEATAIAIVEEAHSLGLKVTAHVGENIGVELALNAGVDEFAHIPCAEIDPNLLARAVDQGVKMVTTLDTLSTCHGINYNTHELAHLGANFIYGSEIGHNDVPWGINAEEMHRMLQLTSGHEIDFNNVLNVFKAATSKAGENLGIDQLGTLTPNAPADIIAVRGNPFEKFKLLEYPDLVISGGRIVVNNFRD